MLPDAAALALFMTAGLALNLAPGPDMLYVIARSVADGRRAGAAAALGIFAGCLVHIFAAAFGLAALLRLVPAAYLAVKYAGALYLLWVGARMIVQAQPGRPPTLERAALARIFRQGAVTNLLNPKVALFFLAFLPQFVDAEAAHPALQMLLLGMLFNASGLIVNGGVALGFGAAGDWLKRRPNVWRAQQRLAGLIFVGLALRLALPERR